MTVANLRRNPAVEVNVVDPVLRKGYRFKGRATVIADGPRFEEGVAFFRRDQAEHDLGIRSPIRSIVLIAVEEAAPLISPAYDGGASEDEVAGRWEGYHASLRRRR